MSSFKYGKYEWSECDCCGKLCGGQKPPADYHVEGLGVNYLTLIYCEDCSL